MYKEVNSDTDPPLSSGGNADLLPRFSRDASTKILDILSVLALQPEFLRIQRLFKLEVLDLSRQLSFSLPLLLSVTLLRNPLKRPDLVVHL